MTMTKKKNILSFLKDILFVLFILFAINKFTFRYEVVGQSMEPTLHDGNIGFALRTDLINLSPKRFDIVTISVDDRYLVKRIIGLPGEKIEYFDNRLYINGTYFPEKFLKESTMTENLEITLADDEYFCLGDNRHHSKDSRTYGPFKIGSIKAVLFQKEK